MADEGKPENVYADRGKALLLVLLATAFLAAFLWAVIRAPTPTVTGMYGWAEAEPFRSFIFVTFSAFLGCCVLTGVYWMVTSSPMVRLDAHTIMYQRFPFMRQAIRWKDVDGITPDWPRRRWGNTLLVVTFHLKRPARAAYGGRSSVRFVFGQALLPTPLDTLVTRIEQHHKVLRFERLNDGRSTLHR